MDENEITQRLREAGDQSVPGEVRATHLSQMHAAVPVVEKPKRFGRLAVAAAAFVGFAVGSTGFAMAGALPAPAQGIAHDVLSVVQVEVPDRKDNRGKCVSDAAKANPNDEAAKKAAKANCPKGKPAHAGQGKPDHAGTPGGPNGIPHEDDDCKGPPPWAGKGAKDVTPEEKQAFKDTRAACKPEPDDVTTDEAEKLEEQQEKDADALEEQREVEAEQQAPPAPADPGAAGNGPPAGDPGAQGQGDPPAELPAPLAPDAGSDAQDTTEE